MPLRVFLTWYSSPMVAADLEHLFQARHVLRHLFSFVLEQNLGSSVCLCVQVVVGLVGWSAYTKVQTGSGLPAGPSGLLGGRNLQASCIIKPIDKSEQLYFDT